MILGATAIALLVAWYAASSLGGLASFQYYESLSEFQEAGMPVERARVHGYVANGSIDRDVPGKQVRFHVQGAPPHAGAAAGPHLNVLYRSLEVPDLFQDGAEVVVEGEMDPTTQVFVADLVLAKCPSKFQADPEAEAIQAEAGTASPAADTRAASL